MKKILSLILVFTLIFSSTGASFSNNGSELNREWLAFLNEEQIVDEHNETITNNDLIKYYGSFGREVDFAGETTDEEIRPQFFITKTVTIIVGGVAVLGKIYKCGKLVFKTPLGKKIIRPVLGAKFKLNQALSSVGTHTRYYKMANGVTLGLTHDAYKHICSRHLPKYYEGLSKLKHKNTFFPTRTSVAEIDSKLRRLLTKGHVIKDVQSPNSSYRKLEVAYRMGPSLSYTIIYCPKYKEIITFYPAVK